MKLFKGVVILTGIKLNSFQAELRSNVDQGELEGGKNWINQNFASKLPVFSWQVGEIGSLHTLKFPILSSSETVSPSFKFYLMCTVSCVSSHSMDIAETSEIEG